MATSPPHRSADVGRVAGRLPCRSCTRYLGQDCQLWLPQRPSDWARGRWCADGHGSLTCWSFSQQNWKPARRIAPSQLPADWSPTGILNSTITSETTILAACSVAAERAVLAIVGMSWAVTLATRRMPAANKITRPRQKPLTRYFAGLAISTSMSVDVPVFYRDGR